MAFDYRAPSVKTLAELKLDCEPQLIRAIWKAESRAELYRVYPQAEPIDRAHYNAPSLRELKRQCIDCAAGYHGVEYLGWHRRKGQHVYYANAGDGYVATLLFAGNLLSVGCWADLVERGYIAEPCAW